MRLFEYIYRNAKLARLNEENILNYINEVLRYIKQHKNITYTFEKILEINRDIYLYFVLATLGLHCCTPAFSSCSEQGLLSSWGVQASHCDGSSCCKAQAVGTRASGVAAPGL